MSIDKINAHTLAHKSAERSLTITSHASTPTPSASCGMYLSALLSCSWNTGNVLAYVLYYASARTHVGSRDTHTHTTLTIVMTRYVLASPIAVRFQMAFHVATVGSMRIGA